MKARPALRWTTVCVDCADAERLAAFYSDILGWDISADDGAGWFQIRDPNGGVGLNFQAEPWYEPPTWPERPGGLTKMLHFEIQVDDLDEAVRMVVSAGGREADHQPPDRDRERIRVVLDPAGHPFCLFVAGE